MHPEPDERPAEALAEDRAARPHLLLSIDSSSTSVRSALIRLRSALAELGLEPDAAGSIELVVAEILNNIGEHAYRGMVRGRIELAIWCTGDMLLFETRDAGVPMPSGRAPAGRAPMVEGPVENIPEGGYGWYLIRRLTADLRYARVGRSNRLTFRMRRDARPLEG